MNIDSKMLAVKSMIPVNISMTVLSFPKLSVINGSHPIIYIATVLNLNWAARIHHHNDLFVGMYGLTRMC